MSIFLNSPHLNSIVTRLLNHLHSQYRTYHQHLSTCPRQTPIPGKTAAACFSAAKRSTSLATLSVLAVLPRTRQQAVSLMLWARRPATRAWVLDLPQPRRLLIGEGCVDLTSSDYEFVLTWLGEVFPITGHVCGLNVCLNRALIGPVSVIADIV